MIGRTFGRLTVLEKAEAPSYSTCTWWLCSCTCGNITKARNTKLKNGDKKSCGCYKAENVKPRFGANHPAYKGHGDITGSIWSRIRATAKQRNISLQITIEDVWLLFQNQNGLCALSQESLYFAKNSKELKEGLNTASLDRIDSSKGYVKGNVQWVHKDINYMKMNLKQDKFIEWCHKISKAFK